MCGRWGGRSIGPDVGNRGIIIRGIKGGYHQQQIFEQYEPTKSLVFIITMYQ